MQRAESDPRSDVAKPHAEEGLAGQEAMVMDTLFRAGELARKGSLLQAQALLGALSGPDSSRIEVLDLLAKVYAQQGKIGQAQGLWLRALQRDPSNLRFLSALRSCACLRKPRSEQFVSRYLWVLIAVVVWFLLAMAMIVDATL